MRCCARATVGHLRSRWRNPSYIVKYRPARGDGGTLAGHGSRCRTGSEAEQFSRGVYFEFGGGHGSKARPMRLCGSAVDVSTGEFRTAEFAGPSARQQAVRDVKAGSSEVLVAVSAELPAHWSGFRRGRAVEDWVWTREFAVPLVERQLNVRSLEGFGLTGHPAAAIAAGVVLHYVRTRRRMTRCTSTA